MLGHLRAAAGYQLSYTSNKVHIEVCERCEYKDVLTDCLGEKKERKKNPREQQGQRHRNSV